MPLAEKTFTFDQQEIERLKVNQKGCYGIVALDGRCIYMGKGDIRARLLAHLHGDNPCILRQNPAYFRGTVTAQMDALEKELILAHAPICNERVG